MATFGVCAGPIRHRRSAFAAGGAGRGVLAVCLGSIVWGWEGGGGWAADFTPWMGRQAAAREHLSGPGFARAGNPQCISPLARPTESPHEKGYYVGGGAAEWSRRSCERGPGEGVWGSDYTGIVIPKKVELGWWHNSRSTSSAAAYRSDGPRLLHRHR